MNTSKKLKKRVFGGLARVASASVINKIIAFISNIIVVRFVNQYEYGLYSSANNVVTMAMLFTGMGTISGVLQYGAENRSTDEKMQCFKYSVFIGSAFNLLLTFGILVYANYNLMPIYETKRYIFALTPTIVLHYVFEYLGAILRSRKSVKEYANLLNVNSVSFSFFSIVGAYTFGVMGLAIGRSISYTLGICMGVYYNRNVLGNIFKASKLKRKMGAELFRYSFSCCIIAALNRLLYVVDVAVIGYILKDANQIAIYRVGTTIPESLEFIPQSVLITVIPYFAEHNLDIEWLKKWTKKLYLLSGISNLALTFLLVLFAPFIVTLFWGIEYQKSTPVFITLAANYFVMATFRQNGTNILSTLRMTNYNVAISIITCISDIILDVVWVQNFGIMGAATATVIVAAGASMLSFPYVYYLIYTEKGNIKLLQHAKKV